MPTGEGNVKYKDYIKRTEYIDEFKKTVLDNRSKLVNIYGERGIGKTVLVNQICEEIPSDILCCKFDFAEYDGTSHEYMVNALYTLCDVLKKCSEDRKKDKKKSGNSAHNKFEILDFKIADIVDSSHYNRIPYIERSTTKRDFSELGSGVFDVASSVIDLSAVGTCLKSAKLVGDVIKRIKPKGEREKELYKKYKACSVTELHKHMPLALAHDLNTYVTTSSNRIIVFIENYRNIFDSTNLTGEDWLYNLVDETKEIHWVLVSQKKVTSINIKLDDICVKAMSELELRKYLCNYGVSDKEIQNNIIEISGGSPFYIERIVESVSKNVEDIDWNKLKINGIKYIVADNLKHMDKTYKEMLFCLTITKSFDKHLFEQLFPGKLFELYRDWFSGTLFVGNGEGSYSVQNSMREEIKEYLDVEYKGMKKDIILRLFVFEYECIRRKMIDLDSTIGGDISRNILNLLYYGTLLSDYNECINKILNIKNIIISNGFMSRYYEYLLTIYANQKIPKQIRMRVMAEIALVAWHSSNYEQAYRFANEGMEHSEKSSDRLMFLSILMELSHIAPDNGEEYRAIKYGELCLEALKEARYELPYIKFVHIELEAYIFLGREYSVKGDYDKSEEYLKKVLDFCKNKDKLYPLRIYDKLARAQEQLGDTYGCMKKQDMEWEMYRNAISNYEIAETIQESWSEAFYLDFGLAYKRCGEYCLNEGRVQEGIKYIESAITKYNSVKERVPEIIDTYCKIGFSYTDAAKVLYKTEEHRKDAWKYCTNALEIVKEAMEVIYNSVDQHKNNNRQLYNICSTSNRILGLLSEQQNVLSDAEEYYKKAINAAEQSIKVAPMHPYGYLSYVEDSESYVKYLLGRNREEDAKKQMLETEKYIEKMGTNMEDRVRYNELKSRLGQWLMKD